MFAKATILLAVLAAVNASVLLGHGALVNTGVSASSRSQDAFGNYAFGYDIKDGLGATNSRSEVGDAHGNKKGSYTLADIDGRARRVDYVADGHGFRAVVKTNEPGTAATAVVGHAASYPAPLAVAAPAVAAPVAYGGVLGHGAAIAAPVAYGGVIGHRAAIAAPVAYGGVIGHGAALAAPVAYGGVLGHGSALGVGYGLGYGKALYH
ncbi:Adult-specific rigid cuticular protein 15.7 like protein [Argiope bruennichi]|uniref:Adult-specific rigid cuticular protein 15.7 like protein n=1 Tax=Argiope bruennichi TaxID=94029 RepID=A0A8T0FBF6_ARGBR|nr:Adult-specific rigid cuticular protein 15.7 like protein [Argiope bruennichi]